MRIEVISDKVPLATSKLTDKLRRRTLLLAAGYVRAAHNIHVIFTSLKMQPKHYG
jgi:hypothetical protein